MHESKLRRNNDEDHVFCDLKKKKRHRNDFFDASIWRKYTVLFFEKFTFCLIIKSCLPVMYIDILVENIAVRVPCKIPQSYHPIKWWKSEKPESAVSRIRESHYIETRTSIYIYLYITAILYTSSLILCTRIRLVNKNCKNF